MNIDKLLSTLVVCFIVLMVLSIAHAGVRLYRDVKPTPTPVKVYLCTDKPVDCHRAPRFDQ